MKLTKRELARWQIDTAVELFLDKGDFLSSLTLASAGEEILGDLLVRTNLDQATPHLTGQDRWPHGGWQSIKIAHGEAHRSATPSARGNDSGEDEVEVEYEHSLAMLTRAITNYFLLESQLTDEMHRFLNWIRAQRTDSPAPGGSRPIRWDTAPNLQLNRTY